VLICIGHVFRPIHEASPVIDSMFNTTLISFILKQ
jgi:hypothetical protein